MSGNRLLATLSPDVLDRIAPEVIQTELGQILDPGDGVPSHVTFPHIGVIVSVVRADENGAAVEVALIGGTGATSIQSALASLPSRSQIIVQVAGPVTRVSAEAVRELFASDEAFRKAVLVYASVYIDQISQNSICNRLHQLEARLAKWLLAARRYAGTDTLTLTHEFLSHMLGVRRAGVTVGINELAMDGLIEHSRNTITIKDRAGLELRACECEGVLREGWERLMEHTG
ncbi:MAG TPA: Crp/Fnr family transcriptional regulator [Thermoanaerobaculia bacterium]|nr:Crp/Fnr family transcriptional regulator [Thermoanaerobaculia bacterium]